MQDKFTRQAANALKLAKTTAQSCNHSYIGTEHILVGLLKEKEGTAGRILEEFNVEEDALRQLIEELIAPSEVLAAEKAPEYSPRAMRVLEKICTGGRKSERSTGRNGTSSCGNA